MIIVLTSHNKIWNTAQVVTDIINEYQITGRAIISLNNEGPCAESIGLYAILDYICSTFNFLPSNITIHTTNFEELHQHYQIKKLPQHWIQATTQAFNKVNFVVNKKDNLKLFGCLYNVPSWERLCLSSYITQKIQHKSVANQNIYAHRSFASTSALAAISSRHAAVWPSPAARCRAVCWKLDHKMRSKTQKHNATQNP